MKSHSLSSQSTLFLAAGIGILSVSFTASAQPDTQDFPAGPRGIITFNDGSWLHGQLNDMDPTGSVSWLHDQSNLQINFHASKIKSIHFTPKLDQMQPQRDFIRMTNNTGLFGKILSMDESQIKFENEFLGNLVIPRQHVHGLYLSCIDGPAVFNTMPPLDQWAYRKTNTPGIWKFTNESTIAYDGSGIEYISREVHFPVAGYAEFILDWDPPLNTNIFICHENELGDNQAFYRFNLRNNSLNIAYEARSRPGVQPYAIGDADLSRYMDGAKSALFRIYIDRINHILAVEINNKNVGVWHADLGENTPPGGNFQIRGNPGHPTTLRNLVIREWNGFPKTIVIDNYKAHENFDTIINLKNEPQLGSILNITSNKENQRIITMQSNNDTPTEIPSAQVHFIVLGQNNDLIKQNIQNSAQQTTSILMVDGNQFEVSNIKFHKDKLSFNVLENETITSLPFNEIVKIDFHDNE